MSSQEDHMLQSQELIASNQIDQPKQTGKTRKNNIFKPESIHNRHYTGITKYDERIYGKNRRNV